MNTKGSCVGRVWVAVAALLVMGSSVFGANFAASLTVHLNPREFNLGALTPAPDLRNDVFGSDLRFMIKQWDDGSYTYSADSRMQTVNLQTGRTNTVSTSLGVIWKIAGKVGIKILEGSVGHDLPIQVSTSSSTVDSQGWVAKNGIDIKIENNLVSAVVTYMSGNVQCVTEVLLGYLTETGTFRQFETGFLAGKAIVANPPGPAECVISGDAAPASRNPLLRQYGYVRRTDRAESVWVLTGWFVTLGMVNGRVVSVRIDPEYELKVVGYRSIIADIQRVIESRTTK